MISKTRLDELNQIIKELNLAEQWIQIVKTDVPKNIDSLLLYNIPRDFITRFFERIEFCSESNLEKINLYYEHLDYKVDIYYFYITNEFGGKHGR